MTEKSKEELTNEEKVQAVINRLDPHEPWLKQFAASIGVTYKDLMEHTKQWLDCGEYWDEGSKFVGANVPSEFWEHYEHVVSAQVPAVKQTDFFSCSC
jgi:hypothetical protein